MEHHHCLRTKALPDGAGDALEGPLQTLVKGKG